MLSKIFKKKQLQVSSRMHTQGVQEVSGETDAQNTSESMHNKQACSVSKGEDKIEDSKKTNSKALWLKGKAKDIR